MIFGKKKGPYHCGYSDRGRKGLCVENKGIVSQIQIFYKRGCGRG